MIRQVEHTQINKEKWDVCIQQSCNESICVYSWYLDAVCDNWSAFILNDYEAVFPIAKKAKFGIHYLYQPFFVRYFGIYSTAPLSSKLVTEFLELICSTYRNLDFNLHELTPDFSNVTTGVLKTKRQFQYLNIAADYETTYKNYSENLKRNLKKAAKQRYHVTNDITPEEIVELFKKTKGTELTEFQPYHYHLLLVLMKSSLEKKSGQTVAVYKDNDLCAAAFFMKSNKRFTYLKSGVTAEGKQRGAMHFLIDHFIRENTGNGYTLDFGGSSVESVARFYKSFGARDCVYLRLEKGVLFKFGKWIKSFKF